MRQEAWDETKTVLFDYPMYDWYLNQITRGEIPWRTDNATVRPSDDILRERILYQKQVIELLFERFEPWVEDMIKLMYFDTPPCKLGVACDLLGVNWRTGKKYHEDFMQDLAELLGIIKF